MTPNALRKSTATFTWPCVNLRGTVSSLSEPPLMSREGLVGREPVLEIGDAYWSLRPGETISKEACLKLLSRIVQEKG